MAAMAPDKPSPRRTSASIANLLLPSSDLPADRSLLSLSHLAASMQPVETTSTSSQRRRRAAEQFARTTSVPCGMRESGGLGVAKSGMGGKRISRRGSVIGNRMGIRAVAAAVVGDSKHARPSMQYFGSPIVGQSAASPVAGQSTVSHRVGGNGRAPGGSGSVAGERIGVSATPSPTVLRPIAATPLAGSKGTSGSNSVESCRNGKVFSSVPSVEFASNALIGMRSREAAMEVGMEVDGDFDVREPSSSSHDAKLLRGGKSRTTPDAKRAQNRESAKRFRVAQKKRWADLQETVERKDKEIARLKDMLQEVTNNNLTEKRCSSPVKNNVAAKADVLALAELDLFVKLMCSSQEEQGKGHGGKQAPIAASIGALYRVIVAKLDGSVLGVRHLNSGCGNAMGGEVGSLLWDHVHSSDSAHLRFTVVHASKMASVLGEEPTVFSYRRKEVTNEDREGGMSDQVQRASYMRMKGCIYPLTDEHGNINSVILAEFVEI